MINFQLSPEQNEIANLARQFAEKEMIPQSQKHDETGAFPLEIFKKAWELGLVNTAIPAEYGGNGLSPMDSVLIGENLAYGCMGMTTSFLANDLALLPVIIGGTHEQKERFLKPFTTDFKMASFCLTEPSNGSDAAGIKTKITDQGDHYLINGQKMWITNAGHADLFVVYGTVDPELKHKGISVVVVEKGTPGVEVGAPEKKMGHRASDTRAVTFNNVKVPKENMIGAPGAGWKIAMGTLDHSRPLVASSAVGGAQRALDCALAYALERKQFGIPLAGHQNTQMTLANMEIKVEAARLLTYKAASMAQQGLANTKVASCAKAYAADICMEVTTDAVQIYGGYGYSQEYPVEKLMRDAKLIQIYEGTSQIQRLIIARELVAKHKK